MYNFILFLHVLGGFGFLLGHGAAAATVFQLPREREMDRVRVLLETSQVLDRFTTICVLVLLLAGITNAFLGKLWNRGWIWASIGLLLVITGFMSVRGSRYFNDLRKAVGLPYFDGSKRHDPVETASEEEMARILQTGKPLQLFVVGYGGFAVIIWLMMYQPF